jgi:hypothetical protein
LVFAVIGCMLGVIGGCGTRAAVANLLDPDDGMDRLGAAVGSAVYGAPIGAVVFALSAALWPDRKN